MNSDNIDYQFFMELLPMSIDTANKSIDEFMDELLGKIQVQMELTVG